MFGVHLHNFVTAQNSVQIGYNWCKKYKSSCNKVASEFFTTFAPDPYRWILNSCSSVFHNVWVHLGPFRYCMKLGANQAELVQLMTKFRQRSRVGIFRNEGTRSISLNPKLILACFVMFECIWEHFITP